MDTRDAYIEQLENTIKNLQDQVSNLTEMVMLLRKEKFAPSSEKTAKQILATGIVEHRRWNVYMMTEGFSYGEKKNFITKKHPNIRPINELPESEIRKDI